MATVEVGLQARVGFASKTGLRSNNEDFAAALYGAELPEPRQEVIAAIADGIGGAKGGRAAAETAVRGFLDGFCDLPETMEVQRAGARIIDALNGWINTQGRQDPKLAGMGCTFTALVLRGRVAHLLHVGDTRAYRLSRDRLACLTVDHVRRDGAGRSHTLTRALGVEAEVRLDYAAQPVALHDRFLLCSDGVHGFFDRTGNRRHPARPLRSRGYRRGIGRCRAPVRTATTIALRWFWTWSRCRRRDRPTSAPPCCNCR